MEIIQGNRFYRKTNEYHYHQYIWLLVYIYGYIFLYFTVTYQGSFDKCVLLIDDWQYYDLPLLWLTSLSLQH